MKRCQLAAGIAYGTAALLAVPAAFFAAGMLLPPDPNAVIPAPPPASCQLSQPVYSPDYQYEGTWTDTLASGQQVTLPDSDRASCTNGVMTLLGHDGTVYHVTGTTRPPDCAELAAEYGDDQFCKH